MTRLEADRRHVVSGLVAAAGLLAAAVWWPAAARASASQIQVGVWAVSGGAPAPPTVPAGGLWVSSNQASGPTAISAVRITVASTDSAPQLTLHVSHFNAPPASPASPSDPILACAVTGQWQPTDPATPGAMSSAPTYDCSKGQSAGVLSTDGTTMAFDLTGFLETGSSSLEAVFVPGQLANPVTGAAATSPQPPPSSVLSGAPTPPAPAPAPADPTSPTVWPTYDATFNPPAVGDVAVVSVAAPDTSTDSSSLDTSSSPAYVSTPADSTAVLPTAAPTVVEPVDSTPLPTVVMATQPAAPRRPVAARAVPHAFQPVADVVDPTSKTARWLTGLVFVGLCGWAWQLLTRSSMLGSNGLITLYDMPERGPVVAERRRFGSMPRRGRAPALR